MQDEVIEPHPANELVWDKPFFYLDKEKFIPKIYELDWPEEIPEGFNAVSIALDGSLKSELEWKAQCDLAFRYTEKGFKIFWKISLGLFDRLNFPLRNQTQFQSLALSLEHFRDTLWKEFRSQTIGLSIYEGPADFSQNFPWDESQIDNWHGWANERFGNMDVLQNKAILRLYCRDAAAEYLNLLAERLPDTLPIFILLDVSEITEPVESLQLLAADRYERVHVAAKGCPWKLQEFTWEDGLCTSGFIGRESIAIHSDETKIGLCLPSMEMVRKENYSGINEALKNLITRKVSFKSIPENLLITEWDGLDDLIFTPSGLSPQGKRKLQGFCAAGGRALSLGPLIGLSNETDYQTYMFESESSMKLL